MKIQLSVDLSRLIDALKGFGIEVQGQVLPEKNSKTKKSKKPAFEPELTADDLFDLWNSMRGSLPKAEKMTTARRNKARAQIHKEQNYGYKAHWTHVIEKFANSEFCLNQWRPTFDDLLNENKRIAAIEGRYDAKQSQKKYRPKTYEQLRSEQNAELFDQVQRGEFDEYEK